MHIATYTFERLRPVMHLLAGLALLFLPLLQAAATPAGQCAAALGQAPVTAPDQMDSKLEFLSWNIQKADNEGWAQDLINVSANINLAFIQEASVQAGIAAAIPVPMYQSFAAGYITGGDQTGVMTLSSGSPSMHCNLTAWEPWLGTPKATAITEYPLNGRQDRLLAINLHAVNFTLGLQNYQAQFHDLGTLLENHSGPIIIAGDMNTWSNGRQSLVERFMSEHGLNPVLFTPDLRTTAFGRALDHVYTRGMRAESAKIIPVTSSDHNPLRVSLHIL